jgi:Methyltransferase domain
MKCKICNNETKKIFNRKVLRKYDVNYSQCANCGFIQTDEAFWLDEAYKNPINIDDTGLVSRNILFAKRSSSVLYFLLDHQKKFLDFAGGYGLFTRLMRDYGFDFYWSDPFTNNLFARGFELDISNQNKFEALTAFECFEHFTDPVIEIEKMLKMSRNILFSTEIFKFAAPDPEEWKYYSFSHGQHISFYSYKSLEWIAQKFNKKLFSNGKSFHLLTNKQINNTLFNTLLILANTGLPLIVKLLMKSKTHSDSEQLKQSNS